MPKAFLVRKTRAHQQAPRPEEAESQSYLPLDLSASSRKTSSPALDANNNGLCYSPASLARDFSLSARSDHMSSSYSSSGKNLSSTNINRFSKITHIFSGFLVTYN